MTRRPSLLAAALAAALAVALYAGAAAAQDPAARRLADDARRLAEAGDAARALEQYQLLVRQFPGDRLAPQALLAAARIHRAAGDAEAARRAVESLTRDYGRSAEAAAGFLLQGDLQAEAAVSTAELEEARNTFRRVVLLYGRDAYPRLEARAAARVRSAELGLLLADADGAQAELLAAIEQEPAGPWTHRARVALARTELLRGDWVAAAQGLQEVVDAGDAAERAGQRAPARRLLTLVHRRLVRGGAWGGVTRFPASGLGLREPVGVAAGPDGEVLVVDDKDGLVAYLAEDGRPLAQRNVEKAARPGFTPDGKPFVVVEGAVRLPFSGETAPLFDPRPNRDGPLKNVGAATRTVAGEWLVTAKGFESVLAYGGPYRARTDLLADRRPEPEDLARDALGRVYVLDVKGGQVLRLDPGHRYGGVVARGAWKRPVAVAVDDLGWVYVLDRGTATVDVYDAAGQRRATAGPQLPGGVELRDPVDLAVDGAGRVFVADRKLPFLVVLE